MKELGNFPIKRFQEQLLQWFEQNMRDLPWRKDRDPYKIWVSEIMLQQTRVDTVIPYFNRFMQTFPTLETLAEAPEDQVLKQWEGLGYYSRARNLQTAVREVKERYGGVVPDDPEEIAKLRGVGSYTAGAILSIAYGRREPAVDGNVMRVFSRLFAIDQDIQKAKTKKYFESLIRELIPENASYFNQGVMELGALICTPKSPQCRLCPVQSMCNAHRQGIQESLPVKTKKSKPRRLSMVAGVLFYQDHLLIRQRGEGLLARLYEFPNLEWNQYSAEESISMHLFEEYDLKAITGSRLEQVEQTFSHLLWDISVYRLELIDQREVEEISLPEHSYWLRLDDVVRYPFPVSHQKIMASFMQTVD